MVSTSATKRSARADLRARRSLQHTQARDHMKMIQPKQKKSTSPRLKNDNYLPDLALLDEIRKLEDMLLQLKAKIGTNVEKSNGEGLTQSQSLQNFNLALDIKKIGMDSSVEGMDDSFHGGMDSSSESKSKPNRMSYHTRPAHNRQISPKNSQKKSLDVIMSSDEEPKLSIKIPKSTDSFSRVVSSTHSITLAPVESESPRQFSELRGSRAGSRTSKARLVE
mmetsp:Transcript_2308/g.5269  ORF Transcript_2308/g.5269 Transcript_2308/m.5269 type:complete len:222 (-) Transcript_2308:266-931(-)